MESKKIHFVGIKGVGMAALAVIAKEMGYQVSGSDVPTEFITDKELKAAGIEVTEFDARNLRYRPDMVVVSAAYNKENLEIKEATRRHLEILTYSEALAKLSSNSKVIAVSGIHGKTTTTAMISFLLRAANLDPSYLVGTGEVASLGKSSHFGQGEYFVLEADEYKKSQDNSNPKFLDLNPFVEVVTSIELDHPDMFVGEEDVYKVFYDFGCRVSRNGFIALCLDYPKARKLLHSIADRTFETYGFAEDAKWRIVNLVEDQERTTFKIEHENKTLGPFDLKMAGVGNTLNATAAVIVAIKLGVPENLIVRSLAKFNGVKRRYEIIAKLDGVTLIDDYAHHPTAISVTLEAIKKKYPEANIWCIFQPHTFSRTKALIGDFAKAFGSSDHLIITDIYASAREREATISGQELALEIRKYQKNVKYISDWEKISDEIVDNIKKPAVVVTLGAGDIYKLQTQLLEAIKNGKN